MKPPTATEEVVQDDAFMEKAHAMQAIAEAATATTLIVCFGIHDDDTVEVAVVGGCCRRHTIRALAEAMIVVSRGSARVYGDDEDEETAHALN